MKEIKQHVQLPNNMTLLGELKPSDALVYLYLRDYFDKEREDAFPSLQKLSTNAETSVTTIRKGLKNLEDKKYIKIVKVGRRNTYYFEKFIDFERFSKDFIHQIKLPFHIKAIYVVLQQYTFKNPAGEDMAFAQLSEPDEEISKKLNISVSTFRRFIRYMEEVGYVTVTPSRNQNGDYITVKSFDLVKLFQGFIAKVEEVEKKVSKNTDSIKELQERDRENTEKIRRMEKQMKTMEEVMKGQSIQIEKLLEEKKESQTMIMN